ncbi:MAG TPA: endonuclease [Paludibacteraceae bacterium]|nr:endonuclease [Paludibacteraceae bacterium]HQF50481.1 endonuclease [Paludibacteraceae bacterium]HQJ89744.1 endonuclease [Paludibacteraceae bacterium]
MKILRIYIVLTTIVLNCNFNMTAQDKKLRLVSYNLENLFDYLDDPTTNDESFTPEGDHQWTEAKYKRKLSNLSKAIMTAGGWETPIIIGLCEVENAGVVEQLLSETPLQYAKYKFVHKDSPDRRGVDVALLYQPDKYKLISQQFLRVNMDDRPTREILFASGILAETGDTLHLFVNHWPSRYGGELESEEKRMTAAAVLKHTTDSLLKANQNARIVIMGDFNDYPTNESFTIGLGCINKWETTQNNSLYNLCYQFDGNETLGSHKFGGKWGMLDQWILSGQMLNTKSKLYTSRENVGICNEKFLLKKDKTDYAPKRSFLGTMFANGFSDHLPIYIDLIINN